MTNEEFGKAITRHLAKREKLCGVCRQLFPEPVSWDAERMEMVSVFHPDEQMTNTVGWLHGGLIATIFDNGLGILSVSRAVDAFAPTATLNIEYLRPAPLTGDVYLHGKITKLGRNMIHARGELLDAPGSDRPFATATAIYFKIPIDKAP